MFIVIDGIDGAWKSTQLELLQQSLEKQGKKVKVISYPNYWKPSCSYVEKYLNWWYWRDVTAKQASLFYALDRYDDSFALKQDFEEYDYILSDRYVSANMIHQWWKIKDQSEREDFLQWVYDLEYHILNLPKPDITLFLDLSVETSQKLIATRSEKEYIISWKKDIHEDDLEHLENTRNVVNQVVAMQENFVKIDCEEGNTLLSKKKILEKIIATM